MWLVQAQDGFETEGQLENCKVEKEIGKPAVMSSGLADTRKEGDLICKLIYPASAACSETSSVQER